MDTLGKNVWTIMLIIIIILVIMFFWNREMFTVGKISNGNQRAELPYVEGNVKIDDDMPPSWNEFTKEHRDY